ncbi:MAG: hypothetical protein ABIH99_04970 [Candidatus Micrarchaeota archaeon]
MKKIIKKVAARISKRAKHLELSEDAERMHKVIDKVLAHYHKRHEKGDANARESAEIANLKILRAAIERFVHESKPKLAEGIAGLFLSSSKVNHDEMEKGHAKLASIFLKSMDRVRKVDKSYLRLTTFTRTHG